MRAAFSLAILAAAIRFVAGEPFCYENFDGPSVAEGEAVREFAKSALVRDNFCPEGAEAPSRPGAASGLNYCVVCGNAQLSIQNDGHYASGRCINSADLDDAVNPLIGLGNRCINDIKEDEYLAVFLGTLDAFTGGCNGGTLTC